MGTLLLTLTSSAIPGSPLNRTVTFADADVPDILAAYRFALQTPSLNAQGVLTFISSGIASTMRTFTQQYRISQQLPPTPNPPPITES